MITSKVDFSTKSFKTYLKVFLIFLLFCPPIFSQNPTFEKFFNLREISQVVELSNGNLVIPYQKYNYGSEELRLLLLNKWGNKVKDTLFVSLVSDDNIYLTNPILRIEDDKLLIIQNINLNVEGQVSVIETNEEFKVLSKKILDYPTCLKFIKAGDGYLMLTGYDIIKLDKDFNLIWRYPKNGLIIPSGTILKYYNGKTFFTIFKNFYSLDSEGKNLTSNTFNSPIHDFKIDAEGKFYFLFDDSTFQILDQNLILQNNFKVGFGAESFCLNENEIVFIGDSLVKKTDLNGLQNASTIIDCVGKSIIKKSTDGFFISGFNNDIPVLVATDEQLNFDKLVLNIPNGNNLKILYWDGEKIPINWSTNNVQKANIYFSSDSGASWSKIFANIPAVASDTTYYEVPEIFSANCFVKIEDASNPDFYTESLRPFNINIYRYAHSSYNNPGTYSTISANQILSWFSNNGMCYNPTKQSAGRSFLWNNNGDPNKEVLFIDGLVWAGKVNGTIQAGGSSDRSGLQPGRILANGKADDPYSEINEIKVVKKKWLDEGKADYLKYELNHWPTPDNAPFIDVVKDGKFNPSDDELNLNADELLYYVANDLNPFNTKNLYGSEPIGLEVQASIFAFNEDNPLKNTLFRKYKIINKGNNFVKDMYLGIWSDPDFGEAGDDLVGCDSTLNLGFVYNGKSTDLVWGPQPPAFGYLILQGPKVHASVNDSALYDGKWQTGYKNLNMSGFFCFVKSSTEYTDPPWGEAVPIYYELTGHTLQNEPIINPKTNEPTTFMLPGNPVNKTGWIDGEWMSPNDRRMMVSVGPFNLAPKDTQEFVSAAFLAQGSDYLNSVTELKKTAKFIQNKYYTDIYNVFNKEPYIPSGYSISQNYPNPFNPTTKIDYAVPVNSHVEIKLYDILGREVRTILNEDKQPGKYRVEFSASGLSSGVYFYRVKAGNFSAVRKMLLIK